MRKYSLLHLLSDEHFQFSAIPFQLSVFRSSFPLSAFRSSFPFHQFPLARAKGSVSYRISVWWFTSMGTQYCWIGETYMYTRYMCYRVHDSGGRNLGRGVGNPRATPPPPPLLNETVQKGRSNAHMTCTVGSGSFNGMQYSDKKMAISIIIMPVFLSQMLPPRT